MGATIKAQYGVNDMIQYMIHYQSDLVQENTPSNPKDLCIMHACAHAHRMCTTVRVYASKLRLHIATVKLLCCLCSTPGLLVLYVVQVACMHITCVHGIKKQV